jgi:HSP20 family protein
MAEAATKLSIKTAKPEATQPNHPHAPRPLEALRLEWERLFDLLSLGMFRSPMQSAHVEGPVNWWRDLPWNARPTADMRENDKAFEIAAELPGMDEKDVEVKVAHGGLIIRGEKQEEKEEKSADYYLRERHFGSFERHFQIPDGVDTDKIDATLKSGVLTVRLPKTAAAQGANKKIIVKAA